MPKAMDPDEIIRVSLDTDAKLPADKRYTVALRYLRSRDERKLDQLLKDAYAAVEAGDETAFIDRTLEAIHLGDPKIEGSELSLEDALTSNELWELAQKYRRALTSPASTPAADPPAAEPVAVETPAA